MRILAIIGSPRTNGNTYNMVQQIENLLKKKDSTFEVEYIQLNKVNLGTCKGCYVCIKNGEEKCPLKDDREDIEAKIKNAYAVIFASPVYTYNVSWIMKNFLDRFAYRCHRPDFQGKKAMIVITTGAVGLKFVGWLLAFMIETMGFKISAKAGLTYAPTHEINEKRREKELKKLETQVDNFFKQLKIMNYVKPSFLKVLMFKMQQKGFSKAPTESADYRFWKEKGWLEKETNYYYKVKVGFLKRLAAAVISKMSF